MKKTKTLIAFFIPLYLFAQEENKGIHFEQNLSWQQVLAKAKFENKYIFVDCYATWCGPCKIMDNKVFPNKDVGTFVNEKFISVKVQMDTSMTDNEAVKSGYESAHELMLEYKVDAFPTYLFFSPNGKIVTKNIGAKNEKDILAILKDALDPNKQYYTLLESYRNKSLDYDLSLWLANSATELGERDIASQVFYDYMHNYLEKLSDSEYFTHEHLLPIMTSLLGQAISSKDRIFNFFYSYPEKADSIIDNDRIHSQMFIDAAIRREDVLPAINKANKNNIDVDWKKLRKHVSKKYTEVYAERIISTCMLTFYKDKRDWKNYIKNLIEIIEKKGFEEHPTNVSYYADVYLNNNACFIFEHSDNKKELETALSWMDRAIALHPSGSNKDSKANILYKLGRTQEAIALEEQALLLAPKDKAIQIALEKMKKGQPTWPKL